MSQQKGQGHPSLRESSARGTVGTEKNISPSFLPSFLPWLDSKRRGQEAWHFDAKVFREVGSNRSPTSNAEGQKVVEPYGLWLTEQQRPGSKGRALVLDPKAPWLGGTSMYGSGQLVEG